MRVKRQAAQKPLVDKHELEEQSEDSSDSGIYPGEFGEGEDFFGEGDFYGMGEGEEGDAPGWGFGGLLGGLLSGFSEGEAGEGEGEGDLQQQFAQFFLNQVRQKTLEMQQEEEEEEQLKALLESKGSGATKKKNSGIPKPFQGKTYYEILGIDTDATEQQIIKAYRKLALQYHPDRNHGDKDAERTFAYLSRVHRTLIDPRKRQMYDKHGEFSVDMTDSFIDAYEHWKQTFGELTPTDTEVFRANYEDTEEEYEDVIKAFNETKGDLYTMMKEILFFSSADTFERDRDMVLMLIEKGRITNKRYIDHFQKTLPTVKQRLLDHKNEEEQQYNAFREQAVERVKRRKGNKYTDADVEKELVQLITRHNRKSDDLLEGVALQYAKQDLDRMNRRADDGDDDHGSAVAPVSGAGGRTKSMKRGRQSNARRR